MAVPFFDVHPPHLLPFLQVKSTGSQEVIMWIKTDLPEPIIRELEVLIRMVQTLMGQPEKPAEPAKPGEFAVQHGGKVIGSLRRRDMYGGGDDADSNPSQHG